jgi:hypothetical protein
VREERRITVVGDPFSILFATRLTVVSGVFYCVVQIENFLEEVYEEVK